MESEKAKAKAGKLYDANNDIELVSEREACKEVCYELNSLRPSQKKERESIIRRLFGKTGKSFLIEQPFYCDYGYNIEIGENFYSNVNCVILDGAKVTFGDNVLWLRIVVSILPDMPWMRNRESWGLNMPILSLSEIMCGLVPRSVCCRE